MAFHVWKKALGCTTFQPHWKAFFNPKAPLLAQKNDALRLNRLFCVHFDLPLGYGLYKERPLDELCRWIDEPFSAQRQDSFVYE